MRLDRLSRKAASDVERAAVAIATAQNVFWGLDRPEHAAATLLDGERRIVDRGVRSELAGHRVRLLAAHDRPQVALDAATALLDDPGARAGTAARRGRRRRGADLARANGRRP